jgi:xanthine dehydrogenase small subunit
MSQGSLSHSLSHDGGCVERPIRFVHRGRVVEVAGTDTTRTLLDWLREDAKCSGTKEGCAEGDCGACTVRVGETKPDGGVAWKTVNACIQLLPMLDGKALQTVEDVKRGECLHPAQQALVDCHGSQCGFCTPGFVMSLVQVYERGGAVPTRQQLADDLAGNLCRCTGYRPILDAGQRMFELPPVASDDGATEPLLATLAGDAPLAAIDAAGSRCYVPRSIEGLAALHEALPDARLLGGCTDIGLWVNKQHQALPLLIATTGVAELTRIETSRADGTLAIGAAATLEAAWGALAARHPELTEMGLRFASPPVRHAGTLGGNLANGSPIGDGAPVLMALDATLVLRKGARERRVKLDGFYLDYMKNALEAGEFVRAIEVPAPSFTQLRAYKLSKRFDSDISGLACGLAITLDGDTVRDARFAFGGMAAVVKRAAQAEAAVRGQAWTEAAAEAAASALEQDFTPITDLRASAAYRQRAAANLLRRFWLETRRDAPLRAQQVSVFARTDA